MMVPGPLFVVMFLQMKTRKRVRLEMICNHQVLGLSVKEGRKEGRWERKKKVGLKKRDWPQSHLAEYVEAQLQVNSFSIVLNSLRLLATCGLLYQKTPPMLSKSPVAAPTTTR